MTLSKGARNILISGSLILALSLGLRHAFGLFLQPVSMANGWGREVFGFAIALQNLVWGVAQPFAGMLSDRYGAGRVIAGAIEALHVPVQATGLHEVAALVVRPVGAVALPVESARHGVQRAGFDASCTVRDRPSAPACGSGT